LSFILAWNDFRVRGLVPDLPRDFITAPLSITTFGQSQFQTFYQPDRRGGVIISIPIALLVRSPSAGSSPA